MTRHPRVAGAMSGLALAASLLVTGCSDDNKEPVSNGTQETRGSQTPVPEGECQFLPSAGTESALGAPVEVAAAGESGCTLRGSKASVQVTAIALQMDPEDYTQQAFEACDDQPVEVDVPDAVGPAYLCSNVTLQGYVTRGTTMVTLAVRSAGEEDLTDAAASALLKDLLPLVQA